MREIVTRYMFATAVSPSVRILLYFFRFLLFSWVSHWRLRFFLFHKCFSFEPPKKPPLGGTSTVCMAYLQLFTLPILLLLLA